MNFDWWTLGFQTINVFVLVWLLGHFFWRPVAGIIAQRRAQANEIMAEAVARRAEAAAALDEISRVRAGFAQERDAMIKAARDDAERLRAEQLAKAAHEVEALTAAAAQAAERVRKDAEKSWQASATRLAVDIAGHLAARLDSAAIRDVFLDWLIVEIAKLPDSARAAAAQPGACFEAISATALSATEEATVRRRVASALGAEPAISFRTDPALIVGLELHGPGIVVTNSWRADLSRILEGIDNGERS